MVGRAQPTFTAIDFETSAPRNDSACAVGLALVHNGSVTDRFSIVIRPPNRRIHYSKIHGLTWGTLKTYPLFPEAAYEEIMGFTRRSKFLVAHNAAFDLNILGGCCERYGLEMLKVSWHCTMVSSARAFGWERGIGLGSVCERLGIPLPRHHDPLCDAEACAALAVQLIGMDALEEYIPGEPYPK